MSQDSVYMAHKLTRRAIRHGILIPEPCEVCGKKAIAHHDDYRLPLQVRWLCRKHHFQWHRENGSGAHLNPVDRDWVHIDGQRLLLGDIVKAGKRRARVVQSISIGEKQRVRLELI